MGKSKKRKPNSGNPAKPAEEMRGIWVRTERTIDGKGWMVTVELDEDHAIVLSPDEVHAYSTALLTACARAEYDAAVIRQLSQRTRVEHAIATVQDLRKDRPEWVEIHGWSFAGGVSQKTRKGFITILHNGEPHSQIDLEPARGHALHVLDALIVADLDAQYMTHLRSAIGLDEPVAANVVAELAVHR